VKYKCNQDEQNKFNICNTTTEPNKTYLEFIKEDAE